MSSTAKLFVWITAGTLALVGGCTVLVLGPCAGTLERWEEESDARADSVVAARAEADSVKAAEKRAEALADSVEEAAGDEAGAVTACQQFVEARLVSPGSADFPWGFEADNVGPRWEYVSYVDSENRFGAKLRTNFHCLVEHTGEGNYRLIDLQMAER